MTKPKRKLSSYWRLIVDQRRYLLIGLAIVVSCTVVWGGLLLLSKSGPSKVRPEPAKSPKTPTGESANSSNRTKKSAKEFMAKSVMLEEEAQLKMNSSDFKMASDAYEKAAQLQKIINRDYPLSQYSDASRFVKLQLEAKNAAAEPLFLESMKCEQQAESFLKKGDFESANEAFNCAIYKQQQLNMEHRDAHRSSASRLRMLENRLAELKSKELSFKISALSRQAHSFAELEELEKSLDSLQEAALLQEQLNANFPDSSYASPKRLDEFIRRGQVAGSFSFAQELREQSKQLMQLLAQRSTSEATSLLVELKDKLQEFEEMFPLSPLIDEQLKAKIVYLHRKKEQIPDIQDQVYDAFIPVPDIEGIQMLNSEISQSLYVQVMDSNPSRNPSDVHPVDSVSWTEATVFCERMSWIMGKEVRLPTEEEFRKALSEFNSPAASDSIWSASTAKGISQPTGRKNPLPSGYFDLLGNVSEWLANEEFMESKTAYNIGGNAQDGLKTILEIPVRKLQNTERNRMIGFRIVVQSN